MSLLNGALKQFSIACRKEIHDCLDLHCDWLVNLTPLYQLIRSKTKTNRDFLARLPATCIRLLIGSLNSVSVAIGQRISLILFFYDTQVKTALFVRANAVTVLHKNS